VSTLTFFKLAFCLRQKIKEDKANRMLVSRLEDAGEGALFFHPVGRLRSILAFVSSGQQFDHLLAK
jgi:hypothetical protein